MQLSSNAQDASIADHLYQSCYNVYAPTDMDLNSRGRHCVLPVHAACERPLPVVPVLVGVSRPRRATRSLRQRWRKHSSGLLRN